MSCNEITIKDTESQINIVNTEEVFKVEDKVDEIVILNNEDVITTTDEIGDKIIINMVDVHTISERNVDVEAVCSPAEAVGNVVYIFASGEVRAADNSNISTAKSVGIIVLKATATSCIVRIIGVVEALSGLTVGKQYFLGSSGSITDIAPNASGSVISRIGHASTVNSLILNINNNYIIRS